MVNLPFFVLYEILEGLLCTFIPLSLSMNFIENITGLLPISYLQFLWIGDNFLFGKIVFIAILRYGGFEGLLTFL
jgi:hypothetical protein